MSSSLSKPQYENSTKSEKLTTSRKEGCAETHPQPGADPNGEGDSPDPSGSHNSSYQEQEKFLRRTELRVNQLLDQASKEPFLTLPSIPKRAGTRSDTDEIIESLLKSHPDADLRTLGIITYAVYETQWAKKAERKKGNKLR